MFDSVVLELAFGLALLAVAAGSWLYLLRASRRPVPPAILRSELGGEIATVSEIGLIAFGAAAVFDVVARVVG